MPKTNPVAMTEVQLRYANNLFVIIWPIRRQLIRFDVHYKGHRYSMKNSRRNSSFCNLQDELESRFNAIGVGEDTSFDSKLLARNITTVVVAMHALEQRSPG